jgi:predicted enzyme related to lactoylglutathione lyase
MIDTNTGRFVWYELMTTDPQAAMPFYSEVIGWTTQPFGQGSDYTMWVGGSGPLGGVTKLPERAAKMGAPPHWMAHVRVTDVDAAVKRVRELDGRVHVEPEDVPGVGRFSIIADPQGAIISLFKPSSEGTAAPDMSKHGAFCWHELVTTDHEAALRFYGEIFGWETVLEHDMGPMGKYVLFGRDGKQYGGMMSKTKEMQQMPNAWLYYVEVSDLDAALERAKGKGARVLNGPMEVPGGARIVQLMDPQGAAFALHEQAKKAS